jgi:hypothetical protein
LIYGRSFIPNTVPQLLYCVQTIPIYAFFEVFPYKKSGNLRSGDRTGRGIPRTWKCFSSLINTLHTPQMHYHRAYFEMAWYLLWLSAHKMPTTPSWSKVLSEICQSTLRHPVGLNYGLRRKIRSCNDYIVYLQRDITGHWF